MKKKLSFILLFILLLSFNSCNNSFSDNIKFNDFQKIEIIKFNKGIVKFKTSFNFLNENDFEIKILNSDFDILINDIDVGSHINTDEIIVKSKKAYRIPIVVEFKPSKVFKDYKTTLNKIKSDIIAEVEIIGNITIENGSEKSTIEYDNNQKVLFTNNKKLELDNKGSIIETK